MLKLHTQLFLANVNSVYKTSSYIIKNPTLFRFKMFSKEEVVWAQIRIPSRPFYGPTTTDSSSWKVPIQVSSNLSIKMEKSN